MYEHAYANTYTHTDLHVRGRNYFRNKHTFGTKGSRKLLYFLHTLNNHYSGLRIRYLVHVDNAECVVRSISNNNNNNTNNTRYDFLIYTERFTYTLVRSLSTVHNLGFLTLHVHSLYLLSHLHNIYLLSQPALPLADTLC